MIKFQTAQVSVFNGLFQVLIPTYALNEFDKLMGALQGEKGQSRKEDRPVYSVTIAKVSKKRSITANGAMWLTLQHLAHVYHTTKDELYVYYLREHGVVEYLAVIPKAVPRIRELFRAVDVLGTVKTEKGVELVKLACYPGSSKYNREEFSHLLEMILEDAKKTGFSLISDSDRDLLLDERDKERRTE